MGRKQQAPTVEVQTETDTRPTYLVGVHIAFVADGAEIAAVDVQGSLAVPQPGDKQLINIPLDARGFAEGFIPKLMELAAADAQKAAREAMGKPVTVEGPALVGANGQPLATGANRAIRRHPGGKGNVTRIRD